MCIPTRGYYYEFEDCRDRVTAAAKRALADDSGTKKIPIRATIFSAVVFLANAVFYGSIHFVGGMSYYQETILSNLPFGRNVLGHILILG
jgi:hypothetical protein